jgi:hypothetical protein
VEGEGSYTPLWIEVGGDGARTPEVPILFIYLLGGELWLDRTGPAGASTKSEESPPCVFLGTVKRAKKSVRSVKERKGVGVARHGSRGVTNLLDVWVYGSGQSTEGSNRTRVRNAL